MPADSSQPIVVSLKIVVRVKVPAARDKAAATLQQGRVVQEQESSVSWVRGKSNVASISRFVTEKREQEMMSSTPCFTGTQAHLNARLAHLLALVHVSPSDFASGDETQLVGLHPCMIYFASSSTTDDK